MRYLRPFGRHLAVLGICLPAAGAAAAPLVAVPVQHLAPAGPAVVTVAADCYTIGQKVAEQNGGQLARAAPQIKAGRNVCIIVVLVPAKDGQRPRRAEFVVPTK